MFTASEMSIDDLMHMVLRRTIDEGLRIQPRKGAAREIVGAVLELQDPRSRVSRSQTRSALFSALGELVWYLGGRDNVAQIAHYIRMYERFGVDGRVEGGYGPRLFGPNGQIPGLIQNLKGHPDSRQAVVQLFAASDLNNEKDVPCTCTLQFLLRGGALNLVVHMRSNDVFLGLPHDIFCFTMIQELVARSVGAELGRYIHMVGSLHIYEEHIEAAESFMLEGWHAAYPMPPMPEGDPWKGVSALIDAEERIREGSFDAGALSDRSSYWDDLIRVFLAFGLEAGQLDEVAKLKDSTHDFFRIYLSDRQQKVSER
jgi:thymidylate synthase